MSFLLNFIRIVLDKMLELFSFGRRKISNKLPIFIRTNTGKQITVNLDPEWYISNVKQLIAPSLGISPDEVIVEFISHICCNVFITIYLQVKIIFAGKELEDSTRISVKP